MTVLLWYLVKRDLSSLSHCTQVYWTSHVLYVTRKTRLRLTSHPLYQLIERLRPVLGDQTTISWSSRVHDVILCASHCFPIFNAIIDWRSSYHEHKNLVYLPFRSENNERPTVPNLIDAVDQISAVHIVPQRRDGQLRRYRLLEHAGIYIL